MSRWKFLQAIRHRETVEIVKSLKRPGVKKARSNSIEQADHAGQVNSQLGLAVTDDPSKEDVGIKTNGDID